jgi:hypothetical protein
VDCGQKAGTLAVTSTIYYWAAVIPCKQGDSNCIGYPRNNSNAFDIGPIIGSVVESLSLSGNSPHPTMVYVAKRTIDQSICPDVSKDSEVEMANFLLNMAGTINLGAQDEQQTT